MSPPLAAVFRTKPGYGLGICDDCLVASHHPRVIAVQLRLRDLEGKVGGTGIKELLVVLLDSAFPCITSSLGRSSTKIASAVNSPAIPPASFLLYNSLRWATTAAAAALRSCVLFCCAAAGKAVPIVIATMESRSCLAEVML